MRIVQLIDSLDYGGAEQLVADLAASQARGGDEVRVVCLRDLGPNPVDTSRMRAAGVEIVELKKPDGLNAGTLRRLASYLSREGADVLHSHNHLVYHYAALAGRLAGAGATLNTLHGSRSLREASAWTKRLYRASCAIGDCVVPVCLDVRNELDREFRLPEKKLRVVENGVDLSRFLGLPRRAAGAQVVFGTIGRLEPVKDHELLVRAFAALRQKHNNVLLRILGDGSLRSHLESLARSLGVIGAVEFEGFNLDTPRFLESIDVYAISSRSEGLPLTLLEAMGAGLPIVATSVGAIPEIVGKAECGWLSPPMAHEAFAVNMERAALATNLRELAERSRRVAASHYTLERMTADYRLLYEALLRRRTRSAA